MPMFLCAICGIAMNGAVSRLVRRLVWMAAQALFDFAKPIGHAGQHAAQHFDGLAGRSIRFFTAMRGAEQRNRALRCLAGDVDGDVAR